MALNDAVNDTGIKPKNPPLAGTSPAVDLTRTECDLLLALCSQPRRVFSGRQLFAAAGLGDWFDGDHAIEAHISRLRRKLGESGATPRYITTVRGVGYRFEELPDASPRPATQACVTVDRALTVVDANDAACDRLALTADEVVGCTLPELLERSSASASRVIRVCFS
jgi:DNA-binding winged helix-turn-helix (wHTH) protein